MSRTAPTASDVDTLWSPRALATVLIFGEAMAAVLTLASQTVSWVFFGLASLAAQWILFLALGVLYLGRRRLASQPPRRLALATFAALMAATLVVVLVARFLVPSSAGDGTSMAWRSVAIVAIIGVLGVAAFENHRRARALAVQAKQAELELLQARIRPHFLFNTLNTATALVHGRPDEAERLLMDLADLFRAALGKHASIPLADELELTRRYLDIEHVRYGDRLRPAWDLPSPLPSIDVPPLSLQPLVENAVRHGIERSREGGVVRITVREMDGCVRVEIRNPLPPADAPAAPAGHGVGLRASTARIEAATAGRGRVLGRVDSDQYLTVVELPFVPQVTTR